MKTNGGYSTFISFLICLCFTTFSFGQTGTPGDPFTTLSQARMVSGAGVYNFNLSGTTFDTYVNASGYVQIAIDFGNGIGNLPQSTSLTAGSRGILTPAVLATLTDISQVRITSSTGNFDVTSSDATIISRVQSNYTLHRGVADNTINDSWTGTNAGYITINASGCTNSVADLHANIVHVCGNTNGLHWVPTSDMQRERHISGEIADAAYFQLWVIDAVSPLPSPGGVSSNLSVWLKGNTGTGSTTDNTAISQWTDFSGNNRHATQATGSQQPTFKNNATDNMNYNGVVDFTASNNNNLALPTSVLPDGTGPFSFYFVSRKSSTNGMTMLGIGSSAIQRSVNVGTNGEAIGRFHTYNNAWAPAVSTLVDGAVIQSSYNYESAVRYMSVNGVSYGSSGITINMLAGGAYVAANHSGPTASNFEGEIAEIIVYTENSTVADKLKIESYLSMKYGITRAGNYASSNGTVIWDATANSTYHNNVAIIGRDDGSGFIQKQSRSVNSGFQPVIGNGSITDLNSTNTSSFSTDQSFMAWGSTTGATTFSTSYEEGDRMDRIWKVEQTGTIDGTVKVGVLSSDVPGANYLNILISNDATIDPADDRYQMSTETIGGLSYYTIDVTIADGQYFTFMNSNTSLPVDLVSFEAACKEKTTTISWTTSSEKNSSHFIVERSTSGNNWSELANVPAAGDASAMTYYSVSDNDASGNMHYYRLTQYDIDGAHKTYPVLSASCAATPELYVYPNPGTDYFNVRYNADSDKEIHVRLVDCYGALLHEQTTSLQQGENTFRVSGFTVTPGIYFIEIDNGTDVLRRKYTVQ